MSWETGSSEHRTFNIEPGVGPHCVWARRFTKTAYKQRSVNHNSLWDGFIDSENDYDHETEKGNP